MLMKNATKLENGRRSAEYKDMAVKYAEIKDRKAISLEKCNDDMNRIISDLETANLNTEVPTQKLHNASEISE